MERDSYHRCAKCGYTYGSYSIRICPHPAVQRVYGGGGIACICVYDCKKCRFSERLQNCDAWRCTYAET